MQDQDSFELIKNKLEKALGVKFKVVDAIQEDFFEEDKKLFVKMINQLEKLIKSEQKLYKTMGIDTSSIVSSYWKAIEKVLDFSFGSEATEVVLWFLFIRSDDPIFEDPEDGTEYEFKTASDLYEYLSYRFNF